jgi:hypothetical protein
VLGFDVDPMDRVVLARTGASPSAIRAYDSSTLSLQGASPVANGCNKQDGVMAYSQDPPGRGYTAFLDCTVDAGQANFLKIRNTLLGNPDQSGTVCTDFCDFDLQTQSGGYDCPGASLNTLPGGAVDIGNVVAAPISWENGVSPSSLHPKNALVAFAFTDNGNGNVGAWAIEQNNNGADDSCGLEVAFGPVGATKEICIWRGEDGKDYLSAVSDTVDGKIWRMDIGRTTQGAEGGGLVNPDTQPSVDLVQIYSHQSPYSRAVGIACAGNYNFILTPGGVVAKVRVLGGSLGTATVLATDAEPANRGLAISRDGKLLAHLINPTQANVIWTSNATVAVVVDLPTGNFKGMRLDDTGRNLYVATTTTIARYDLASTGAVGNQPLGTRGQGSNQTCINSAGVLGSCNPVSTNGGGSSSGGAVLASSNCGLDFLFGSSVAMNAIGCGFLFLIIPFASVGAGVAGRVGAGIGGGIGAIMLVAGGSVPKELIFLLVLAAVILAAIRWGSGDE